MKKYVTPSIEKEVIDAADIVLSSTGIGGGIGELPPLPVADGGSISGSSAGKITIGSSSTGGFSAGDILGNR